MRPSNRDRTEWNSQKVQQYFLSRGIDASYLASCPQRSLDERLYSAGEAFREAGWHGFTSTDLAMLANNNRWNSNTATTCYRETTKKLSQMFGQEAKHDDLVLPAVHVLRIKTGNYNGNLHQAKGYEIEDGRLVKTRDAPYPNVLISSHDWRTSVALPLPLWTERGWIRIYPTDVSEMLGLVWGMGRLVSARNKSIKYARLFFSGDSSKGGLVEKDVADLFKKIFNVALDVKDYGDKPPFEAFGHHIYPEGAYACKGSLAIASWLYYEMGFSPELTRMPNIALTKEQINGFLKGVVKSIRSPKTTKSGRRRGKVYEYTHIDLQSKDKELIGHADATLTLAGHGHGKPYLAHGITWIVPLHAASSKYFIKIGC